MQPDKSKWLKSYELMQLLPRLGFEFGIHNEKRKHPELLVWHEKKLLPPKVRFYVMREKLHELGIPDSDQIPLKDICYLMGWRSMKEKSS